MHKNVIFSGKKEKCIILTMKKSKVMKRLKTIKINNDLLIIKLINNGILDQSIKKLNNKKILLDNSPVLSEDYLDSYNHYIHSLDNFIDYFYDCFNHDVESGYDILSVCLKNNDNIFLDKKYVYNNDNTNYYKKEYNKILVNSFYYNINYLYDELKEDMERLPIKVKKIDMNNTKDIDILLDILIDVYLCNRDKHIVLSLFNKVDSSTYKYYLNSFEFMFYTYFKRLNKN